MFDPISLAVGAALLAAGHLTGWLAGRRSTRRAAATPPVCGCGHGLEQHDPDTKACHAQVRRDTYNKHGDWVGDTYVACTCRQYVGPTPVEQLFNTPILPPSD